MFVVTVEFVIKAKFVNQFQKVILKQAHNSLISESACHRFDVFRDLQHGNVFFLYEIYTDEAAFEKHLSSQHFKEFDATIKEWVERKSFRKLKFLKQ
jgi:(4S)-4-hydroxy-5-phosphonooxypentane-2,3-dione isomerase